MSTLMMLMSRLSSLRGGSMHMSRSFACCHVRHRRQRSAYAHSMTTPIAAANCTVHLPDGSKHENMIVESNRGQLRVKRRNGEIVFESSASAVRFGERPMSLEIDVPKRDERGELLIGEKATVLVLRGGGCGCGGSR